MIQKGYENKRITNTKDKTEKFNYRYFVLINRKS